MRPYCIGLTGGIGAGKSLVSERFAQLGAGVIDTDLIARELTSPGGAAMAPLQAVFGDSIVSPDGSLDRVVMRTLIFTSREAKLRLEGVLHPMIRAEANRLVAASCAPYVLLVVPLLVEHLAEYLDLIDRLLLVDCPETLQVERASMRPGMSAQQVEAIMASQVSRSERQACADDVINNDADIASLDAQVREFHRYYLGLAVKANRK